MKTFFILLLIAFTSSISAQNVGVGTTTPAEKLDVNGNINVTGTIKVNGVDGQPNQVLMKNSGGTFVWGDIESYKNYATFINVGAQSWTVPAGVTKIWVEAWGGGGGVGISSGSGGGGGGYVSAIFTVVPSSTVNITVGTAGTSGGSPTAGGNSTVSNASSLVIANGGAIGDPIGYLTAPGGGGSVGGTSSYFIQAGEAGHPNKSEYYQGGTSTFYEALTAGKGGDGANSVNTGGRGTYILYNITTATNVRVTYGSNGRMPGGGAGALGNFGGIIYNAGQGMVIIHY